MRLMDGIGIFLTELTHDFLNLGVVLGGERVADEALKLEGAALALVIEFVVQRLGDVGIHADVAISQPLLHDTLLCRIGEQCGE